MSRETGSKGPEDRSVDDLIASMERETEAAIKKMERQELEAELQRRRDYLVGLKQTAEESLRDIRNEDIKDSAQLQRLEEVSRGIFEPRIEETRQRIVGLEKELKEFGD